MTLRSSPDTVPSHLRRDLMVEKSLGSMGLPKLAKVRILDPGMATACYLKAVTPPGTLERRDMVFARSRESAR